MPDDSNAKLFENLMGKIWRLVAGHLVVFKRPGVLAQAKAFQPLSNIGHVSPRDEFTPPAEIAHPA